MKKKKSNAWRPTKLNESVVQKLVEWFKMDFTTEECCSYAWISKMTFYDRYKKFPDFSYEIDSAKNYLFIYAKKKLAQWIQKGWFDEALRFLERRQRNIYTTKKEVETFIQDDTISPEEKEQIQQLLKANWL